MQTRQGKFAFNEVEANEGMPGDGYREHADVREAGIRIAESFCDRSQQHRFSVILDEILPDNSDPRIPDAASSLVCISRDTGMVVSC
jgi:hypothetical protein